MIAASTIPPAFVLELRLHSCRCGGVVSGTLPPADPTLADALIARGFTYRAPAAGLLAEMGAKDIVRMSDGVVVTTLKASAAWEWLRAFDRHVAKAKAPKLNAEQRAKVRSLIEDEGETRASAVAWVLAFGVAS